MDSDCELPPLVQHGDGLSRSYLEEEQAFVICRICEQEIATEDLESHTKLCAAVTHIDMNRKRYVGEGS